MGLSVPYFSLPLSIMSDYLNFDIKLRNFLDKAVAFIRNMFNLLSDKAWVWCSSWPWWSYLWRGLSQGIILSTVGHLKRHSESIEAISIDLDLLAGLLRASGPAFNGTPKVFFIAEYKEHLCVLKWPKILCIVLTLINSGLTASLYELLSLVQFFWK